MIIDGRALQSAFKPSSSRSEGTSAELRMAIEAGGGLSTLDVVVVMADACGRYDLEAYAQCTG